MRFVRFAHVRNQSYRGVRRDRKIIMKLESLAQIAEILGGIAVLVSLVFLIIEIQENTAVSKAATYQHLTGQALDLMVIGKAI